VTSSRVNTEASFVDSNPEDWLCSCERLREVSFRNRDRVLEGEAGEGGGEGALLVLEERLPADTLLSAGDDATAGYKKTRIIQFEVNLHSKNI
jgi:hypothetical protein